MQDAKKTSSHILNRM